MRKYGKFERMPDGTRAKPPKVKNVLLQTYFTSLLCMVLCVSMFFGTSYAWFTSEVKNQGNEIYIGTLKVDLDKKTGNGENDWASLSAKNEDGTNTNSLFDKNIRWEPGYTALETIKVVNEGDLAFKYNLTFTDGLVNGAPNNDLLVKVAKNFVVYVHAGEYEQGETYDDFKAITASEKWKPVMNGDQVATLADILQGNLNVLSGSMMNVRGAVDPNATLPGPNDSNPITDTYIIALHMNEETDSDDVAKIMGQKIQMSVKLVAYQMSKETGAFAGYDQLVMTPADLKEAMENGGNVTLLSDIKLNESVTVPAGVAVNLNLNGHSITNTAEGVEFGLKNNGNLIVTGEGTISGAYAGLYSTGTLIVNGGTFNSANGFGLMIDNIDGTEASVATINNGIFKGVGVYNPTKVTINRGTFNVGRDPDGATDHISDKMTLFVSPTFVGAPNTATVTLNGGTFNGDIYVYDDGITETVFTNNGATITGNVLTND